MSRDKEPTGVAGMISDGAANLAPYLFALILGGGSYFSFDSEKVMQGVIFLSFATFVILYGIMDDRKQRKLKDQKKKTVMK